LYLELDLEQQVQCLLHVSHFVNFHESPAVPAGLRYFAASLLPGVGPRAAGAVRAAPMAIV
jgi:hypothetical protein